MSAYLLDANLLLALSDPMPIHHEVAHRWFGGDGNRSWATCPITENGFIRTAHPNYPNRPGNVTATASLLRAFCEVEGHHFWADDVSLRDLLHADVVVTHGQVTDVYLLGLAAAKGGKLATLDQHIPAHAVRDGAEALELIAA